MNSNGNFVYFITEGATERRVGLVLYNRKLLAGAQPKPGLIGLSREGYNTVINEMHKQKVLQALEGAPGVGLLLIFDQEGAKRPKDRTNEIEKELKLSFHPIRDCGHDNVFETQKGRLKIVLHISNAAAKGITNRDFDGYILNLLQGPYKKKIAKELANGQNYIELLKKSEEEMTNLMQRNHYPWSHNKSWIYAYITAFQFRKSHVWFAEEVVKKAPKKALREVFSSLIDAWNWLVKGECR